MSLPAGLRSSDEQQTRRRDRVLRHSIRTLASENSIEEVATLLQAMMTEPLQLVRAMAAVGSIDRAVEIVEAALCLGLPVELAARLRCLLVESRIISGSVPEALGAAEEVLLSSGEMPTSTRAATEASRVFGRYFLDAEQGRRQAEDVLLAHDGRIGTQPEALAAAAVLSDALLADGRLTDAVTMARTAARSAYAMPSPLWRPYLHLVLAERLTDSGAYEESESALQAARAEMGGTNAAGVEIVLAYHRARLLGHQGQLTEARDEAQRALSSAVGVGARLFVPPLLDFLSQLALWSGDVHRAATLVRRCRDARAREGGALSSIGCDWADVQVTAARQGPVAATRLMAVDYAFGSRRMALFARHPEAAAWFVRTALAAGDREWAATAAATAQRLADRNTGIPALAVAALHANSLLHGSPDGLVRAATEHRHHRARTNAAEDLTTLLSPAVRHRAPFAQVPSGDLAFKVPAEEGRAVDESPLSDAEHRVASLVSEGLTNQQVALRIGRSPHTVNFHLRNIFRKLGVGSRVELARRDDLRAPAVT